MSLVCLNGSAVNVLRLIKQAWLLQNSELIPQADGPGLDWARHVLKQAFCTLTWTEVSRF
jgi:hypothetical protein